MTSPSAPAWLLEYAPGYYAAFGLHATLALIERPAVTRIPGTWPHCIGLMQWESSRIPLLDLSLVEDGCADVDPLPPSHALVMSWRASEGSRPELGALAAPRLVNLIHVSDGQQCPPPEDLRGVQAAASSWFMYQGEPVAVFEPVRLFAGTLPGSVSRD